MQPYWKNKYNIRFIDSFSSQKYSKSNRKTVFRTVIIVCAHSAL